MLDRSSAPAARPPRGSTTTPAAAYDLDPSADDPWYAPSVADGISLSSSGARRLAEAPRVRAFVMPELDEIHASIETGTGTSIVLDSGLYRAERMR